MIKYWLCGDSLDQSYGRGKLWRFKNISCVMKKALVLKVKIGLKKSLIVNYYSHELYIVIKLAKFLLRCVVYSYADLYRIITTTQ